MMIFFQPPKASFIFISSCLYDILGTFLLTTGLVGHSTSQEGEERGVRPNNTLMGMCRWMGSYFHDWIDHNGVALSIELLE